MEKKDGRGQTALVIISPALLSFFDARKNASPNDLETVNSLARMPTFRIASPFVCAGAPPVAHNQ